MERLFEAGAVDVWLTPIVMKKNRLATKISVLIDEAKRDAASEIILKETSSIGVRFSSVGRQEAERKVVKVETPFGTVRMKVAYLDGEIVNVAPEYEDVVAIAKEKKIAFKTVYSAALKINL